MFPRPVDVKIQHRHRRRKRLRLAPLAIIGRLFQRQRDSTRIIQRKNTGLKIQGVAGFGNLLGPIG